MGRITGLQYRNTKLGSKWIKFITLEPLQKHDDSNSYRYWNSTVAYTLSY